MATNQSRGIRNNNPGNIDYNPVNNWKGQLPFDPVLEKHFAGSNLWNTALGH